MARSKPLYLYTLFCGRDGVYYDPVGNEFFTAQFLRKDVIAYNGLDPIYAGVYVLDFGDEKRIGALKDHGYHLYLGEL